MVDSFGLMYYQARWYNPQLGRFAQADSMVPGAGNPMAWDRYAYVMNNPLRFIDPSGHFCIQRGSGQICSDDDDMELLPPLTPSEKAIIHLKTKVKIKYGITLSDDGDKAWDLNNCRLASDSLGSYNRFLGGKLKPLVGSGTWTLLNYTGDMSYSGFSYGTNIIYYTIGQDPIRQMNIYHEFGHTLNSLPDKNDVFSNELDMLADPSFIGDDGYIAELALKKSRVFDPYFGDMKAVQASNGSSREAIADIFANFVAGNIDLSAIPQGEDMHNFITGVLVKFIWIYKPDSPQNR